MKEFLEKNSDYLYFVFRVLIGVLFLLHGVQKVTGIYDGKITFLSLIGLAAVIETIGSLFIIIGLFTRYTAIITAGTMLVAYFTVHAPGGLNPLVNKGEAALLYFAAFLAMIAFGSRKWSLDNLRKK
ncbi:DoxX family protein [Candidatus Woesearchaeota archaeon]|nr:DoxX family protein [Candidatus Woesearchaeota archaeon]